MEPETHQSIKFKEVIAKLEPGPIAKLEWPFETGAALSFFAKNDELYKVVDKFVLAEQNFNDADYLTVINSHDRVASNNVIDDRFPEIDNCCPDVPNPLNINWYDPWVLCEPGNTPRAYIKNLRRLKGNFCGQFSS